MRKLGSVSSNEVLKTCVDSNDDTCLYFRSVPQVLGKCIEELERRGGLEMEGVYRVPGNHEVIEDFRIALDKG